MTTGRRSIIGVLGVVGLFAAISAVAETPHASVQSIDSDETLVYVHEAKKLEVRAHIPGAATDNGLPKWNLVQVDLEGKLLRYIGVLYYSPKKQAFFRKLELQEREPGQRYFEVLPDDELEPFVTRSRPRLVITVATRPSIIEIWQGVWKKILGRLSSPLSEAHGAEPQASTCSRKLESNWESINGSEVPKGTKLQKGIRGGGGVFAAVQANVEFSAEQVATLLWNPGNIKNPRTTRIKVEELNSGPGLRAKKLDVNLRPFLFVNLDWQELWERRDSPGGESVRIDYRKIAGEERLKHFCGWMEVRRVGPSSSEVTLYEEIDSPHRTADEVAKGHLGTLGMLSRTLAH